VEGCRSEHGQLCWSILGPFHLSRLVSSLSQKIVALVLVA
jgi:hypothetical protein